MSQLNWNHQSESAYLDQPDFRKIYGSLGDPNSMKFHVAGIKCSKCIQKIEDLPKSIEGLVDVRVNIANGMTVVQIDPQSGSFSRVADAIRKLGFLPEPIQNDSQEELARKKELRQDLIRLAIVGACAGNIMTFSFANYFGQVGVGAQWMNYLSLILFLPVLFYGGIPFYQGAYLALKGKTISVDTPITIAFVFGSICSIWSLFTNRDLIYFDSLSGFLFLILLSRWFQKRLQRHFLSKMQSLNFAGVLRTFRKQNEEWVAVPGPALQEKDLIQIREGEIVPADVHLVSASGLFDFSFLTGESMPRSFTRGMHVPAGTRCLSQLPLEAEVASKPESSEFARLMQEIREGALHKVRALNLADRAARILLITVFTLATLFLLVYWQIDPEQAIARSLALVILACPCAMAFGTPLALSFALKKSVENGILIKSADVFEKLATSKNIFLDKTGTITTNRFRVVRTAPENMSAELVEIILQLEVLSHHPIAFAIREFFSDKKWVRGPVAPVIEFDDHIETPGVGVSGLYGGRLYEVKRAGVHQEEKRVGLFRDGVLICELFLSEELLPGTESSLEDLRQRGYSVTLVSGDHKNFVCELGQQLGISQDRCFGELSPLDKAMMVGTSSNTVMIGDGVNDSLALQKAQVGIAVRGSVEIALRTADIYLLHQGIGAVPVLFDLAHRVKGMLRKNITISLIYNSVGGIAALLGYVNPFVAALLMPISSGIILFNSWWESRS